MTPSETQEKIDLYRQALSMVFSKGIASKTKIRFYKSAFDSPGNFWVNKAFHLQSGAVVLSPTGWKPFTPEEFDAETEKLFNQALDTELKMSEAKQ